MNYLRTLIIASTLLLSTITVGDELPESAAELAKQFCSAHTAGDYAAIEKLIYWQGVEKKMKNDTEQQISARFPMKIRRCYVTSRPSVFSAKSYNMNGKTYRPNLKPIGTLRVEFDLRDNFMTGFLVGKANGNFYITLAAPR